MSGKEVRDLVPEEDYAVQPTSGMLVSLDVGTVAIVHGTIMVVESVNEKEGNGGRVYLRVK